MPTTMETTAATLIPLFLSAVGNTWTYKEHLLLGVNETCTHILSARATISIYSLNI